MQWTNYALPLNVASVGALATLSCGWADPLTIAYIKVATALVVMIAALFLHKTINLIWRLFSPSGKVPLPSILAFPRLEIAIASTTVICYAESFGVLLSSGNLVAMGIGIAALVYSTVLLLVFFVLIFFLVKHRPLLKPNKDEEEKDLLVTLLSFFSCGWKKGVEGVKDQSKVSKSRRQSKMDHSLMVQTMNPSFSAGPRHVDEEFASDVTGTVQPYKCTTYPSLERPSLRNTFGRKSRNKVSPLTQGSTSVNDGKALENDGSHRSTNKLLLPPLIVSGQDGNASLAKVNVATSSCEDKGGGLSAEAYEPHTCEKREPSADLGQTTSREWAVVVDPLDRAATGSSQAKRELLVMQSVKDGQHSHLPSPSYERGPIAESIEENKGEKVKEETKEEARLLGEEKTKIYHDDGMKVVEPVTKLMNAAERIRCAKESSLSGAKKGTNDGDGGLKKVSEKDLLQSLIKDRLGSLYEEYRVINAWTVSFFYASCVTNTALGVLVGVQLGAKILPTSRAAFALNILACLVQLAFTIYLTWIRPQLAFTGYVVEAASQWLQTVTLACIVALQSLPFTASIQNAMTWIQVAVIAVKVFSIFMLLMSFLVNFLSRKKVEKELKTLEVKSDV